ncbi:MAG: hypothetical protein MPW14_14820 [Candidatus Manganitrophus sp.]|nr:MAG: hypothetical protein MPW14_14820 [Candidatus Manganitrophus sp.]
MVGDALLDVAAHVLGRVELRLLRQVADLHPGFARLGLALEVLIDPRHDAQQGGLARTVEPQHADLGAGVKRERNVFEDLRVSAARSS